MNSLSLNAALLMSVALLAGCGTTMNEGTGTETGTGSGLPAVLSEEEQSRRLFADGSPGGDLSNLLSSGAEVYARSATVAGKTFDYEAGTSGLTTVSASLVEIDGVLNLTINGQTFVVDPTLDTRPDDVDSISYSDLDGVKFRDIRVFTDEAILDALDETTGTGFAELYSAYVGSEAGDFRSFFVVGAETTDEAIETISGSVQYTGFAIMRIDPNTEFVNEPTSSAGLNGALSLVADFDAQTVSGQITDLYGFGAGFPEGGEPVPGALLLEETTYSINGFEGGVSSDQALDNAELYFVEQDAETTYSGVFYGTEAQEVGGVITYDGQRYNGVGGFFADSYPQ